MEDERERIATLPPFSLKDDYPSQQHSTTAQQKLFPNDNPHITHSKPPSHDERGLGKPPIPENGHSKENGAASNAPSAAKKKWQSAIFKQRLLNALKQDKPKETPDPFGERMADILNQHPAFQFRRSLTNGNTDDEPDHENEVEEPLSFSFSPLISRNNLLILTRCIKRILNEIDPRQSPLRWMERLLMLLSDPTFYQTDKTSWEMVKGSTLGFALSLLVATVAFSHVAIVWSSQVLWYALVYFFLTLVDWEYVKGKCPNFFKERWKSLLNWYNNMEDTTLMRHRFYGREWTKKEFLWQDMTVQQSEFPHKDSSQTQSLIALPPPTVREGRKLCIDSNHLKRPEWSNDTTGHIVALDYVYVMLREEQMAKLERKRKRMLQKTQSSDSDDAEHATKQGNNHITTLGRKSKKGSRRRKRAHDSVDESIELSSVELEHDHLNQSVASEDAIEVKVGDGENIPRVSIEGDSFISTPGRSRQVLIGDDDSHEDGRTSLGSGGSADTANELPWFDVTAKIGMRLLNSAHVHRAAASTETAERIIGSSMELLDLDVSHDSLPSVNALSPVHSNATSFPNNVLPSLQVAGGSVAQIPPGQASLAKPVHPLWTSATAAGQFEDAQDICSSSESFTPPASPRNSTSGKQYSSPHYHHTPTLSPTGRVLERIPEDEASMDDHRLTLDLPNIDSGDTEVVSIPTSSMRRSIEIPSSSSAAPLSPPPISKGHHRSRTLSEVIPKSRHLSDMHVSVCREPLAPGIKVAVPLFPIVPPTHKHNAQSPPSSPLSAATSSSGSRRKSNAHQIPYQMGTVVSSKRIYVGENEELFSRTTNCLSVTVKLDKSFLRNAEFAELTFRVMDSWSNRYMPKHSKVPIGSSVATAFGLGVLVGWRVEDDCHVIRSLWKRRGPGSAQAYLNRDAIHGVVEAAVGFRVETKLGMGRVLAYVDGGQDFRDGRYCVQIKEEGRHKGHVMELNRKDILACHGVQFIPVIEHIREAAHFQIQVDNYRAALREGEISDDKTPKVKNTVWQTWSSWADILWASFLTVVSEDKDFDDGMSSFLQSIINFLERLDGDAEHHEEKKECGPDDTFDISEVVSDDFEVEVIPKESDPSAVQSEPGLWLVNDFFGGLFSYGSDSDKEGKTSRSDDSHSGDRDLYYERAFAALRIMMKTISVARVASVDHPHLRLALASVYDVLLFIKKFIKVQQRNVSGESMEIWTRAIEEIYNTFGPIKDRFEKIGRGIAQRMEKQGRKAKARLLKFFDTLLGDERLLFSLEQGDWEKCAIRLELALIKARIIEKKNLVYYRKTVAFVARHWKIAMSGSGGAATRNSEKLAFLAQCVQWIAAPRRSMLKLFERADVLEFFERVLVRVFHKQEVASRMVIIHASNFHSLRHLRLLKDFSTSGRLWMPVLDAADEEFSFLASQLPENTRQIVEPISALFSLCVTNFHKINEGDLTLDWMDFLFEDQAVEIIHDIDTKLILAVESFARDVKDMMLVLPYYSSIDDDLLGLMDEVDIDEFLREASEAIEDQDKLNEFIREKATIAIERFLNYLPRMSIPVEKRELVDGWVLTCRSEDGGDLTLSDVKVKRENLTCQVLGGDALFFPMFGEVDNEAVTLTSPLASPVRESFPGGVMEESVLDHIRDLLIQAQSYGCWKAGVGGVASPPSDRYVASVLNNMPVTTMLNCGIELWRNLEIDDDELLEIAIRDVSYQIQLQKERELKLKGGETSASGVSDVTPITASASSLSESKLPENGSFDTNRKRFNPRVDPTVFFLEMRNLTLNLDKFKFRIEKGEQFRTILDPVIDGKGSLLIQNVSIRLRVECAKERKRVTALGEALSPVLVLKELTTSLEKVDLKVKDTGFGSDWIVNKAVDAFSDDITKIVAENLRDQILEQVNKALENLNSYFLVNPNLLLDLLGISMDDLDDYMVWV